MFLKQSQTSLMNIVPEQLIQWRHENYMVLPLLWSMGSKQGARERPIINLSRTLSHNRMPDKHAERLMNGNVVVRVFCHLSLTYILLIQFTTDDVKTSLRVKRVSLKSFITRIVLNVASWRVLAQSMKMSMSPRKQWATTSSWVSCGRTLKR